MRALLVLGHVERRHVELDHHCAAGKLLVAKDGGVVGEVDGEAALGPQGLEKGSAASLIARWKRSFAATTSTRKARAAGDGAEAPIEATGATRIASVVAAARRAGDRRPSRVMVGSGHDQYGEGHTPLHWSGAPPGHPANALRHGPPIGGSHHSPAAFSAASMSSKMLLAP